MSIAFTITSIVLTGILSAIVGTAMRVNISDNWEEKRCDTYVVPIAGFFKPPNDPRSPSQFARDNWAFCQKEFVQNALRTAAEVPKAMTTVAASSVGAVQGIASTLADIFYSLWNFCFQTYTTFMEKMKGVAKLFQNFLINLNSIVERLHASALAIVYALISLIVSVINSVQVTLIVGIIVIGIIAALQILLFFIFLPISGLIISITAAISVMVVAVVTTIAAAVVAELFTPGACFVEGTLISLKGGPSVPIEKIKIGDVLGDGGRVTAVHQFETTDTVFDLWGIAVTGDHLVMHGDSLIPVREHPEAVEDSRWWSNSLWCVNSLWCLTSTTRRIPVVSAKKGVVLFADWEEIDATDTESLEAWYREVWSGLNKGVPCPPVEPRVLAAEAGMTSDCLIACQDWMGRQVYVPIQDIKIGQRVFDSPTTTTRVVGKVVIAGDQTTDAVEFFPNHIISCASWVKQRDIWTCGGLSQEIHPVRWEHLYTKSGVFMLKGGWLIRDASDLGLGELRSLVDRLILHPNDSGRT